MIKEHVKYEVGVRGETVIDELLPIAEAFNILKFVLSEGACLI